MKSRGKKKIGERLNQLSCTRGKYGWELPTYPCENVYIRSSEDCISACFEQQFTSLNLGR